MVLIQFSRAFVHNERKRTKGIKKEFEKKAI